MRRTAWEDRRLADCEARNSFEFPTSNTIPTTQGRSFLKSRTLKPQAYL
jgi:hypothetical protein